MANPLENQLLQATKIIENQVDAEIERLEKMDDDDFEILRQRRMEAMKKSQQQKQEWLAAGHGEYSEIADEKEFFETCKKSKKVVCHFYRDATIRCKIVDKHLTEIARKHIETKFVKINAERSKFLVERLRITTLPTICLARDGKTVDYIVGFDDLGGTDEFPTEMLEWRLARSDMINYQGDLLEPPTLGNKNPKSVKIFGKTAKNLRDDGNTDSDDDDW
ncbi:thioredoxin domain-containing protein 9 [Biomphalaria glabrata]|uniref:Thioredoxin domain-containing protein 9 n=1 Tax=Biomphalaria glabrata TaxID=6526 RepID=A0A9W3B2C5_BIOGL|nr:thioredoxin domain-containing protein 9-like [Biomphalaria glabrata]XP_055893576.1 thioredoxin domain-containing protein 9-like [Biomphalaria glabrata]XP_055893577.1 thioredoxin domain-containing protein 9-like [Biomphalaria glabrata]KAI8756366.1 thioredoxin domain-containing protein 9-like [Biomphalaria glabrata]